MPKSENAMGAELPQWFAVLVGRLFACYPQAVISSATAPAWWELMQQLSPAAVAEGFRRALDASPTFVPSAVVVRDHARSAAKSGFGHAPPSTARAALSEPEPELPEGHPMREALEGIKARTKRGEISGLEVMRAVIELVTGDEGQMPS